ncbi:polysaccharide deacetylase family protein [Silvibacterium acidisoli]|uniref:polysaccharide deacetylase family protein n=1 Tax=Acidobacteriaceae bacterium ZG23-2 TaxID=2883246 RepID=UPI00406CF9BA
MLAVSASAIAGSAAAALGLAAGGYAYAGMWPTSQIFGRTLVAGRDPNEYALTYDDGPNDACTERLLEVLAAQNTRATFFMIGRFVRERGELVRKVRAAGHLVGNHTFTHPVLLWTAPKKAQQELAATNAALEDALGEKVSYFRPPHGARRPDVLRSARELGLTPVLWNAMGYDWRPVTAAEIVGNLEKGIRKNRAAGRGSNLLLHDGGQAGIGQNRMASVEATNLLLKSAQGVRFVTVDAWG